VPASSAYHRVRFSIPFILSDANPPWKGSILRRPHAGVTLNSDGNLTTIQIPATGESFVAREATIAMEAAETTIQNTPDYHGYAHRLGEMKWQECSVSEDEWNARCVQFLQ